MVITSLIASALLATCPGDLNSDETVDFLDVTTAVVWWGNPYDFTDLETIVTSWGSCMGASVYNVRALDEIFRTRQFVLQIDGDSFSVPDERRVAYAMAFSDRWPYGRWGRICGGSSESSRVFKGVPIATPSREISSVSTPDFRIMPASVSPEFFALPIRGSAFEFFADAGLSDSTLLRLEFWNNVSGALGAPRFGLNGEIIERAGVVFLPTDTSLAVNRILFDDVEQSYSGFTAGALNLLPTPVETTIPSDTENRINVAFKLHAGDVSSDLYAHPAGGRWSRMSSSGVYGGGPVLLSLADNSWEKDSHAHNAVATSQTDKRYTNQSAADWLSIANEGVESWPHVFLLHIATEGSGKTGDTDEYNDWLSTRAAIASAAGVTGPVFYAIVISHTHSTTGGDPGGLTQDDIDEAKAHTDAVFAIAQGRANRDVAAISLAREMSYTIESSWIDSNWLHVTETGAINVSRILIDLIQRGSPGARGRSRVSLGTRSR